MNEEIKIVEKLKILGGEPHMPNEEKFLKDLRIKLSDHIAAHSAISEKTKIPWFSSKTDIINYLRASFNGKVNLPSKAISTAAIVCLLGASSAAVASQDSLPGEALYPIKILTEDVRSSLAVTPESKAKIQSSFAAKRVEEVKAIMEKKDVSSEILDIALTNLQKNTDNTAVIIDEEGKKGTDVAELAKNISTDLNKNTEDLKQIFEDKNTKLKEEEEKIKNKIEEAKKNDDQKSIASLNTELDKTNNKRKSLESSWNKNEEMLKKNDHRIKKQTEKKRSEDRDENKEQYDNQKKDNGEKNETEEEISPDQNDNDTNNTKEKK